MMKTRARWLGKGDEGTVRWIGGTFSNWWRGWWYGGSGEQEGGGGIQVVGSEAGGDPLTDSLALTLASVWRCTALIAETLATLPLNLYEKPPAGKKRVADEHPLASIIGRKPNDDQTAINFWECIVRQAVLNGNGFARKRFVGSGSSRRLAALELLSTPRLTWRMLPDGSYEYRFTKKDSTQITIPEAEIFHLPGPAMWGKFGLSTILYGARTFGAGLAANQTALRTFRNGHNSTTYFKIDRVLQKAQREEFHANTKAKISGALNAGAMPLLEGGMDVGNFGLNPDVMQLLESRAYSKEEVCTWFGVPPSMIGSGDKASSWASSSESLNLWFLQYTLSPWMKRIEQAIWKDLLTPEERSRFYASFNPEGLLRANTAGRAALYASALQNGWMNRNEVRSLEDLPALEEGGDQFTVQSNLIPIDQLSEAAEERDPAMALEDALKNFLQLTQGAEHGSSTH